MAEERIVWREKYNHPITWDQDFPLLSLPDMFMASAARKPQAALIDFMGRKFTYAECGDGIRRVARGLQAMGVGRGDRIGLFLPNVPHYVAAYYGAMAIGATVVNFSPLYTPEELASQVEDSGTKVLFTLSAKALLPAALEVLETSSLERLIVGSVAGVLPATKSILFRLLHRNESVERPDDPRITAFSALIANDGNFTPAAIDPDKDIALLQYTGGTTGQPKGAKLSHQNLSANARQVCLLDPGNATEDRIIGALPFFHVFANTVVLNRTVFNGGEIVMLPRFDSSQALAAVARTRPTSFPGVPTMYQALLDHPDLAHTDFSSVRVCISGGAPLPAEVKRKFEEATGTIVVEGYGLTESSGVVSANPYLGLNKTGTIGQPLPCTIVKLLDKEDPTRAPPEGEPGEIAFSGPQVMKGYWNRPEADAEIFAGEFLRTGDVGLIDEDGYIRVVDRMKDMIAVGGFKVFPSAVEKVLYRHPLVKEALVIGIPDPYRGESPKAFVTLAQGATADGEALKDWLNPQLGKHERVVAVEIRETLPKTMVGKLSRKELVAEERAKVRQ